MSDVLTIHVRKRLNAERERLARRLEDEAKSWTTGHDEDEAVGEGLRLAAEIVRNAIDPSTAA